MRIRGGKRSSIVRGLGAASLAAALGACVDGTDPMGVGPGQEVSVQAAVSFATIPTNSEVFQLRRARLSVLDVGGDSLLSASRNDIEPSEDHWLFQVRVPVPFGGKIPVKLQVELASLDSLGGEHVQWAGETAVFEIGVGLELLVIRQVRPVTLYRGPADNLSSISIALDAPAQVTFGESVQLRSTIEGGGPDKVAFYESLDPAVALVDPITGRVEPLDTGTVRVMAHSGPAVDTASIAVVPPKFVFDEEWLAALAREVDYYGSPAFVVGMQDVTAVREIALAFWDLGLALANRDVMEIARAFRSASESVAGYAEESERIRAEDRPQVSLMDFSLMVVGDALSIPFGREGGIQ